MRTEEGVRRYWEASLAWRGVIIPEGTTIETLFRKLDPLYTHTSFPLARQAVELGDMIVKHQTKRKGKNQNNVVQLHQQVAQKAAAA